MKKYIIIGFVFVILLGAGIVSYFLYWGPELPRAIRKMDRLNSVTIDFTGGRIFIEGNNVMYDLNNMDLFYCHLDDNDFSCYDQYGNSFSPNPNISSTTDTGLLFNRFSDFLKFECEYSTDFEKYICVNNEDPDADLHAVRFVLKDGYVSSMDLFIPNNYGVGFITFTFSKYNQTNVNMP